MGLGLKGAVGRPEVGILHRLTTARSREDHLLAWLPPRLRLWLTVLAPSAFLLALEAVRGWALAPALGADAARLAVAAASFTGIVVFALLMHVVLQRQQARLAAHGAALLAASERERLGRELHDGSLQRLYGLGLQLESARALAAERPELADQLLRAMVAELDRSVTEIRGFITQLRLPPEDGLAGLRAESRSGIMHLEAGDGSPKGAPGRRP